MLRFLTAVPPGKVRFTIFDPVGLGQNFSTFMNLKDVDELMVNSRIWTEQAHIEQRLLDLTEHMENVIQTYLRNEYQSIEQYNEMAGEVAEPYRSWSSPTTRPTSPTSPSDAWSASHRAARGAGSTSWSALIPSSRTAPTSLPRTWSRAA